jgi:hypothetical protein
MKSLRARHPVPAGAVPERALGLDHRQLDVLRDRPTWRPRIVDASTTSYGLSNHGQPRDAQLCVALLAEAFCDVFAEALLWRGALPSPAGRAQ